MWLKLTGSILVIAAGGLMGFSLAARYQNRPKQVRQLINGIVALKSYIRYASTPLAEAFSESARGLSGVICEVFTTIGKFLRWEAALTPQEAITRALETSGDQLALKRQEKEAFILFGANLGKMNREEQERYCDMLMSQLEKIEHDALALRDQNVAMYRYLGVCGGMTVAILLI
ncbi:stage III sporulation protein AB [Anaerosporomusa subterranea]|uniref:Stage III sporulation protein AB n=1 Tax=Anaerosporomusa subterranea TaxID=1794912 RepID=A0A154BUQ1_ANASB|nr:stage III sporulation protein AB [Anaerosporomusa subterranea]KYZ77530.1 stage III sporulation protein AB [Anaerosporomusa subterranea]